ncbi:lipopolysaccharide biosynthesis protein [Pseudalkalibacillus sp. Hm43]|uniref:lipopolysaccharide biosynthesis protein n=1 Tax=Pseudalkalibacillus sp. Hm43 TaxID=3450742 RepID=UPI003F43D2B2
MLNKRSTKDFIRVLFSNGLGLLLGMVITFLLPIKLSVEEYGYWQLYFFYSGYVGLFMIGFADGIHLRYAGIDYNALDKGLFRTYFRIVLFLSMIMAFFLISFIAITIDDPDRAFVLVFVCLNIILFNINGFFIHVNQISSRFNYYSWATVLNRLIFAVSIIPMFFMPITNYKIYIIVNVISRVLVVFYSISTSKDIVFGRATPIGECISQSIENIRTGLPLTISAILSMFLLSYTRIVVDKYMGIEEFGLYSFAISILSIILQVVMAVSAVLYPLLRKIDSEKYQSLNIMLNQFVIILGALFLCTYFPANIIIGLYLPKFSPILDYLYCLYPIMIYQAKSNIVLTTFYKTLRLEKWLLVNNLLGLIFCVSVTILSYKVFENIISIVVSWVICYVIWIYYSEWIIKKKCNWSFSNRFLDIVIIFGFLLTTQIPNLYIGLLIYILYLIILGVIYRKLLSHMVKKILILKTS